MTLQLGN